MSTNAQNGAAGAAMKRLPTLPGQGPVTPNSSAHHNPSTPQPHHVPGSFTSPALGGTPKSFGTPRKGMLSGKTFPGTGVTPNASFSFNLASPSMGQGTPQGATSLDALASFPTPSVNGMSLNTLDAGAPMGLSLSSLGVNMSTGLSARGSTHGKIDDAERRRRLLAVLDSVGKQSGRLSREGLERVGRRCQLDMLPEEGKLVMAGKNAVMVDVEFDNTQPDVVNRVALEFLTASDAMSEHSSKAAQILQDDLTPARNSLPISAKLDRFAQNLSRLATMDRLSVPGASCFDAVFGVYTSLRRLYDHERHAAEVLLENRSEEVVNRHVLRKKSGYPNMHVRNTVGLSVDYWSGSSAASSAERPAKRQKVDNDMDIDIEHKAPITKTQYDDTHGLIVECEVSPPALYTPIRISSEWISERIIKPSEEHDLAETLMIDDVSQNPIFDWLDPPAAIVSSADGDGQVANNSSQSQPHVRFVAKLQPPVAVPLHVAAQIYSSLGINIAQDILPTEPLLDLIMPSFKHTAGADEVRQLHVLRRVGALAQEEDMERDDKIRLFWTKPEMAIRLETLPFAHPRELIQLLPVLRQYAFVQRLLQNTYASSATAPGTSIAATGPGKSYSKAPARMRKGDEEGLAALLASSRQQRRILDVSFTTTPAPQVTLALTSKQGLKKATFNILPNADVEILSQDIISDIDEDDDRRRKRVQALAQALETCEDLGIWAAWVRKHYLQM